MSIVLRVNKGSALTYDEMDKNQSQFYYSSSLNGTNELRLHLSGSAGLGAGFNTRYDSVFLPVNTTTPTSATTAAGNSTQIQFNDNDAFAADSVFVFKSGSNFQGIGTADPQARLHIKGDAEIGARVRLEGAPNTTDDTKSHKSSIDFYDASELISFIGRVADTPDRKDLDITNRAVYDSGRDSYGKIFVNVNGPNTGLNDRNTIGTFSFDNDIKSFGVGTDVPTRNISVVGAQGIGLSSTGNTSLASYIAPIPTELFSETDVLNRKRLVPTDSEFAGLLISSPNTGDGGNVVIAINTDNSEKEGFNVIKSKTGQYTSDKSSVLLSAKVDGTVGINTNFATDVGLTVAGVVSGSGNLTVGGTATVKTIAAGSSASTSTLVATTGGLVQKIAAAPVPLGGIIMWSGAPNAVPEGWTLCDGTGDANGVTVPNLVNRFIVASNSTGATATTNIEGSDNTIGGSNTHNHAGNTGAHTLTVSQIPSHLHCTRDAYYIESGVRNNVVSPGGTEDIGGGHGGSGDSDRDNNTIHFMCRNTASTGGGASHSHTIDSANNIPAYYALAFIIYVGV